MLRDLTVYSQTFSNLRALGDVFLLKSTFVVTKYVFNTVLFMPLIALNKFVE